MRGIMKKSELRKLIKEELLKERIIKLADNSYEIKETKFEFLVRIRKRGLEGIVFLGAGGKLND